MKQYEKGFSSVLVNCCYIDRKHSISMCYPLHLMTINTHTKVKSYELEYSIYFSIAKLKAARLAQPIAI